MTKEKISTALQPIFIGILLILIVCSLLLISSIITPKESQNITTSTRNRPTIVIDAGHGGEDGGASSADGTLEKDLNLSLALKLESLFSSVGYNVVMTRTEDKLLYDPNEDYMGRKKILDMKERVRITNSCENPILISIHMNAFPEERYKGLQVYYSSNDPSSESIANSIQKNVCFFLEKENTRKTKCGRDIFLLDRINSPAVLIECGFLSNPDDASKLSNEKYQENLALCIFYALTPYTE